MSGLRPGTGRMAGTGLTTKTGHRTGAGPRPWGWNNVQAWGLTHLYMAQYGDWAGYKLGTENGLTTETGCRLGTGRADLYGYRMETKFRYRLGTECHGNGTKEHKGTEVDRSGLSSMRAEG